MNSLIAVFPGEDVTDMGRRVDVGTLGCRSVLTHSHQRYRELGGIINEHDHASAFVRAQNAQMPDGRESSVHCAVHQATAIARYAKIQLERCGVRLDPRVLLYIILRLDTRPPDVQHHHSQMCDQRIFAEAVRMAGDAAALEKVVAAYPNISFY